MDPMTIIFVLLLLFAVILFFSLYGPIYIGVWMSLYWIYQDDPERLQKVHEIKYDSDRVYDQYWQLYDYWLANRDTLGFMDFTVPLFLPPIFGAAMSLLFAWLFVRYVRSLFTI